jgi:hypothetical protein
MTVRSEPNGHRRLRATAAELQVLADLIQKYPAETQLIMGAHEDGLTLGPMHLMDTEQGDFTNFVEGSDERKSTGLANAEDTNWGILPAVKIAELLGVADAVAPSAVLDDLHVDVDARLGRIIYEQAVFHEVYLHRPIPEPRMPPEGTDATALRAMLATVVDQVCVLGEIGGAYRSGAYGSSKDPLRCAGFQSQAMAYKMAAIRLADALDNSGGLIEVKHQTEYGNKPDPT